MSAFIAAVFFLLITPGPGVLSVAGVGASFGYRSGIAYMMGLCVGTNLAAIAVVLGLAAIILADPLLRTILVGLSAGYLGFLAFKIAFSGRCIAFINKPSPPGFIGGLMLQFVNPKNYAVNTALFSGFAFLPENYAVEVTLKFLITNVIWICVHLIWLGVGLALHRLNLPEGKVFAINCTMALSMLIAVGLIIGTSV